MFKSWYEEILNSVHCMKYANVYNMGYLCLFRQNSNLTLRRPWENSKEIAQDNMKDRSIWEQYISKILMIKWGVSRIFLLCQNIQTIISMKMFK